MNFLQWIENKTFRITFCDVNDVLILNISKLDDYLTYFFLKFLNLESKKQKTTLYLDLHIDIGNNGRFEKQDYKRGMNLIFSF